MFRKDPDRRALTNLICLTDSAQHGEREAVGDSSAINCEWIPVELPIHPYTAPGSPLEVYALVPTQRSAVIRQRIIACFHALSWRFPRGPVAH